VADLVDKRRIPPSRRKYQLANPAVSTRISLALNARIEELVGSTHLSKAAILRMGLEQGADRGTAYKSGYLAALTASMRGQTLGTRSASSCQTKGRRLLLARQPHAPDPRHVGQPA
jgi:predicted transcriptional regulator